jgi:hypothetical protein
MDLHDFPMAVARAAVMHVLGEMCVDEIAIADPLVIITGRGNHASRQRGAHKRDYAHGVLKKELVAFIRGLGLEATDDIDPGESQQQSTGVPSASSAAAARIAEIAAVGSRGGGRFNKATVASPVQRNTHRNPGRLYLSRSAVQCWLERQKSDDAARRSSGTGAHGNLFLNVARAKQAKVKMQSMDVRAVCPFSSAVKPKAETSEVVIAATNDGVSRSTAPQPTGTGDVSMSSAVELVIEPVKKSESKGCPFHLKEKGTAEASLSPAAPSASAVAPFSLIGDNKVVEIASQTIQSAASTEGVGKTCSAHALASDKAIVEIEKGTVSLHDEPPAVAIADVGKAELEDGSQGTTQTKGGCPFHSQSQPKTQSQ